MTDEELRALAEACKRVNDKAPHKRSYQDDCTWQAWDDAASPDVVLGLLDRLDAANAALLQSQAREAGADARIKALEVERDEAREAVRLLAGALKNISQNMTTIHAAHGLCFTVLANPAVKKIVEGS